MTDLLNNAHNRFPEDVAVAQRREGIEVCDAEPSHFFPPGAIPESGSHFELQLAHGSQLLELLEARACGPGIVRLRDLNHGFVTKVEFGIEGDAGQIAQQLSNLYRRRSLARPELADFLARADMVIELVSRTMIAFVARQDQRIASDAPWWYVFVGQCPSRIKEQETERAEIPSRQVPARSGQGAHPIVEPGLAALVSSLLAAFAS